MRKLGFVALGLLLATPIVTVAQGGIQKSTDATERACSEKAVVVAASFYHQGESHTADMIKTACAKAPVTLTRLIVLPDGFVIPYFKNLDSTRSVVGAAFWITSLDAATHKKLDLQFKGGLLHLEPGAEIRADSLKPLGPIKAGNQTVYLVSFSSIRFDNGSEWHFDAECELSKSLTSIACKKAEQ